MSIFEILQIIGPHTLLLTHPMGQHPLAAGELHNCAENETKNVYINVNLKHPARFWEGTFKYYTTSIYRRNRVPTDQLDLNSLTFPDISRSFSLTSPDLAAWIWQVSHKHPSEVRKNFVPINTGFYKNLSRNTWQKIWFTCARSKFPDFPWLSTKNIEIPWLSLTFLKKIFFPDFPWWWEPCRKH